jgi:hypothetical protein
MVWCGPNAVVGKAGKAGKAARLQELSPTATKSNTTPISLTFETISTCAFPQFFCKLFHLQFRGSHHHPIFARLSSTSSSTGLQKSMQATALSRALARDINLHHDSRSETKT